MKHQLRLRSGAVVLTVTLRDTPTAQAIAAMLPIESQINTWGDEVYFRVPVSAELEDDARDVVQPGELAFWLEGQCIAIGFGPTPISRGDEIRLAARTNIWGDTADDVRILKQLQAGDRVRLEAVTEQT